MSKHPVVYGFTSSLNSFGGSRVRLSLYKKCLANVKYMQSGLSSSLNSSGGSRMRGYISKISVKYGLTSSLNSFGGSRVRLSFYEK